MSWKKKGERPFGRWMRKTVKPVISISKIKITLKLNGIDAIP